jgi:hypothetical protein
MLTTSVEGVWVLQALVGVESMPAALHLKPFIPSAHGDLVVETTLGRLPLVRTAQYHSLAAAGVIDEHGQVDAVVRDWMTVLGRPEREVVLTIRRPDQAPPDTSGPTVSERVMAICRHRRFVAMAARDGNEMVIGGVGEADEPDRQIDYMCQMIVPALGDHPPADVDGVNLSKEVLTSALDAAAGKGPEAMAAALRSLGLGPWEVQVLGAAAGLDSSAMAVVVVVDHGAQLRPHPRVLTVADTEYGRVSMTTTTGADGKEWVSFWPTTPAGLREDLGALLAVPQLT